MDRPIVQVGSLPLADDPLLIARAAMMNDGHLASMILGGNVALDGLPCAAAAMAVTVGAGTMSVQETVDASDYGVLPADAHALVKLYALRDAATLPIAGAGTWCVQATNQELDVGLAVDQYYNAANPAQALNGPSGSGAAQASVRSQVIAVSVIAGAAAQSGYVGIYVVTVPAGAGAVTQDMISRAPGAPFIDEKLQDKSPIVSPLFVGNPRGPTRAPHDNSISLATTAYVDEAVSEVENSTGTAITNLTNQVAQDLTQYTPLVTRNADVATIEGQVDGLNQGLAATNAYVATLHSGFSNMVVFGQSTTWTKPAGITRGRVRVVGGGGGATGSTPDEPGAGGGGGGYAEGVIVGWDVNAFDIAITVGSGGAASVPQTSASTGGTSSFGPYLSATGGEGGLAAPGGPNAGGAGGGGYGTFAQIAVTGGSGGDGLAGTLQLPGYGGASVLAPSVRAGAPVALTGGSGTGPGGGGAGCYGYETNGGSGAAGIVIVEY